LSPRLWLDRSHARHSGTLRPVQAPPGGPPAPRTLTWGTAPGGSRLASSRACGPSVPTRHRSASSFPLGRLVSPACPPCFATLAASPLSRSSMGSSGLAVTPGSSTLLCCSDSDLSPCDVAFAVFPGAVLRSTFVSRVTPLVNFLAPSELWASSRFGPIRASEDLELPEHSFLRFFSPSAHRDGVSLLPSPERDSDADLPANFGAARRFSRLRRLAPPPPVAQVSLN